MRVYKHHTRELDNFTLENPYPRHLIAVHQSPNLKLCETQQPITTSMIPRVEDVDNIDDAEILRVWHQIARRTWALANRLVLLR